MPRPFEVDLQRLRDHLDEMVEATFTDLQSQFLVLPKGRGFLEYRDFQNAYETLKRRTVAFTEFTEANVWMALREDGLVFLVLRTILGMTPPEWADLARGERGSDVSQGYSRGLDGRCRADRAWFARLSRPRDAKTLDRVDALISVAVQYIREGAPPGAANTVHRLDKVDTAHGLVSLQHAAAFHVPYAMLLYERYLGRPFASYRDAVSELVGDVMETAIEDRLSKARISYLIPNTRLREFLPG